MPGFDGTGPQGAGPMTGGARGNCTSAAGGFRGRGAMGPGYGRRFGGGRGFGRGGFGQGQGAGYYPAPGTAYRGAPGDDASALKAEAEYLKGTLDRINQRLTELEQNA